MLYEPDSVELLASYMATLNPGRIKDVKCLAALLEVAWPSFEGCDEEGMHSGKLQGRIDNAHWDPPTITFEIDRDGAMMMGSTRAQVQRWEVDLLERSAWPEKTYRYRQLSSRQPSVYVKPLAEELAGLMLNRVGDPRWRWIEINIVKVEISKVIQDKNVVRDTLVGRRKRFRAILEGLL